MEMFKIIKALFRNGKKPADCAEDTCVKNQTSLRAAEQQKLEQARDQAEQAFQRGGLDREQAYGAYGLDANGNWLKK